MDLFLASSIAVVFISVLIALIIELVKHFSKDDYKVPNDWKSSIDDTRYKITGSAGLTTRQSRNEESIPKAESAFAWYAIFIIAFIVCLIVLTNWESIEEWLYSNVDLTRQIRGNPRIEVNE